MWSATRRPFIHPLATPAGMLVTRDAPDDHPWHHGLWFTIKFVNGENFWEEYDEYGVLHHDGPPAVDEADDALVVSGAVRWIGPDRSTVVIDESRTLAYRPLADDAYVIDLDTTLMPRMDVVLDRTPFTTWGGYGGLTLRGNERWADTRLLLSDNTVQQQIHGRQARWCDLSSPAGGLTMVDHPGNPRFPTPWYGSSQADTYGDGWANFFNAAFLWNEALTVGAAESLRLRYRIIVHDGMLDTARLDTIADAYAT